LARSVARARNVESGTVTPTESLSFFCAERTVASETEMAMSIVGICFAAGSSTAAGAAGAGGAGGGAILMLLRSRWASFSMREACEEG
jgi:hypothetical protein